MTPELRKAMFACTSKGHPNKALHGILFCDDYVIASDSTQLVKIKKEFDFDCYVELEDGSTTGWDYPETKYGVFLTDNKVDMITTVEELTKAAKLIPESEDVPGKHIAIDICGRMIYPPILINVLAIFEKNGATELKIQAGKDRIQIEGKNTCSVVMALMVKDNPDARCKEAYTVAQILAMEGLL